MHWCLSSFFFLFFKRTDTILREYLQSSTSQTPVSGSYHNSSQVGLTDERRKLFLKKNPRMNECEQKNTRTPIKMLGWNRTDPVLRPFFFVCLGLLIPHRISAVCFESADFRGHIRENLQGNGQKRGDEFTVSESFIQDGISPEANRKDRRTIVVLLSPCR